MPDIVNQKWYRSKIRPVGGFINGPWFEDVQRLYYHSTAPAQPQQARDIMASPNLDTVPYEIIQPILEMVCVTIPASLIMD